MQFAHALGFTEDQAGKVALIATELSNNLANHAKLGELLISTYGKSLDLLSIDRGPGMNVHASLEDGYSTAGTPGTGLGAIRRLSDRFDAYSTPSGTILLAGLGPGIQHVGCVRVAKKGESVCGDAWSVVERGGVRWIMIADGLGHGLLAAQASEQAVQIFERSRMESVTAVMEEIDAGLRVTRGAAVAVAEIRGDVVNFSGLGNISGAIHSPGASIHMVSHNGTAGLQTRKPAQFSYVLRPGSTIIMHSDGLHTQWGLERYPGILRRHPAVVAGTLYRDFSRGSDDVTVLVVSQ